MAGDVLWTKLKSSWRGLSVEHRKRALGLYFIFVVALIWVMSLMDHLFLTLHAWKYVKYSSFTRGDPGVGLLPGARLGV